MSVFHACPPGGMHSDWLEQSSLAAFLTLLGLSWAIPWARVSAHLCY